MSTCSIKSILNINNVSFCLFYIFSTITAGTQFQCDLSLATGRDLPRIRGRRATSAGFDTGDLKLSGSFVLHNVVVVDAFTTHHRLKLK